MPTLLEIGTQIRRLEELLVEADGDITGIEDEVDAWFEDLGSKRDEKLDAYARLIAELEARATVRETEAMRLSHRASVDTNKAKYLRQRLQRFFETAGLTSIETDRYRLTLARHGGKTPVVVNVSPEMLPRAFQKVKTDIKADLDAIRSFVESRGPLKSRRGEVLAHLGERGKSIRIR